jgi:phosphoribosylanthranilate isomerase
LNTLSTKIKVCGITRYEDAAMALDEGADALGFNFYPRSPRYIEPSDARSITRRLPPLATTVGVFVNVESPAEVAATAAMAGVRVLQLHGDETPAYCRELSGWVLIKAVRIGAGALPDNLREYDVQAFLADSRDDGLFGGTGRTFDWPRVREIQGIRPLILAGGLHPGNVADAIRAVRPYAVDVCSGVESAPGKKDLGKLREFITQLSAISSQPSANG